MNKAQEMNLYVEELENVRNSVDDFVKCRIFTLYRTKRLAQKTFEMFRRRAEEIILYLEGKEEKTPCENVAFEFCCKIMAM